MLKLDKQAPLELPRLFREGMVYDDETMVTPGWGLENGATECSGQGYMRVHSEKHNRCRKPLKSVPKDSWLCFCEDSKSTRASASSSPMGDSRGSMLMVLLFRSGRKSSYVGRLALRVGQGISVRGSGGRRPVVRSCQRRSRWIWRSSLFRLLQRFLLQELDDESDGRQSSTEQMQDAPEGKAVAPSTRPFRLQETS